MNEENNQDLQYNADKAAHLRFEHGKPIPSPSQLLEACEAKATVPVVPDSFVDDVAQLPFTTYHEQTPVEPEAPVVTGDSVEVAPGIFVSRKLIDEAVEKANQPPGTFRPVVPSQRGFEISKDVIVASQAFVQSLVDKAREPSREEERWISYDALPSPLRKLIDAYAAVTEAQERLDAANQEFKRIALEAVAIPTAPDPDPTA